MKKNITINLYGTLYAIDEDACTLLEQYLDNMRSYFSQRDGGDEIADDIEHRVAELFSQLKEEGCQAISIEHVQDIITRIGNPEQMDDEADEDAHATSHDDTTTNASNDHTDASGSTESTDGAVPPPPPGQGDTPNGAENAAHKSWFSGRKLYRDPQDQMLGGVVSGLCKYFGGTDPLPWRILTVILLICSFTAVGIIYLIAWAIVPAATTAGERLQMCGTPVNPQTLSEELMRTARDAANTVTSPEVQNKARSFMGTLLRIFIFCLKLIALFVLASLFIAVIACFVLWGIALSESSAFIATDPGTLSNAMFLRPIIIWAAAIALLTSLVLIIILTAALLRSFLKSANSHPLSSGTRATLMVSAIVCAALALGSTILYGVSFNKAQDEARQRSFDHNGVFIKPDSYNTLDIAGWKVLQAEGCNKDGNYVEYDDDLSSDGSDRVILSFRKKSNNTAKMHAVRQESFPAGNYHLEAVTDIDGKGMQFYAKDNKQTLVAAALDARYPAQPGNLRSLSLDSVYALGLFPVKSTAADFDEDYDDWSFTRSASFYHAGGPLTYGVYGSLPIGATRARIALLRVVSDGASVAQQSSVAPVVASDTTTSAITVSKNSASKSTSISKLKKHSKGKKNH